MKHHVPIKSGVSSSLLAGCLIAATLILVSAAASAQSPLQNNTPNNLQPQSAPTQQSSNTQSQVGTLQNNNGSTVLNQNGSRPLGVVSSPNQTSPTVVAEPSNTTKAEISNIEEESNVPRILLAIGALAIAATGAFVLTRGGRGTSQDSSTKIKATSRAEAIAEEKPVIRPEPLPTLPANKSRKQQRRKKKKKSGKR